MRRPREVMAAKWRKFPTCVSANRKLETSPFNERAKVDEQPFRTLERLHIGRFEPAKVRDILDTARFQRQHHLREIESLYFRQFLRGPL